MSIKYCLDPDYTQFINKEYPYQHKNYQSKFNIYKYIFNGDLSHLNEVYDVFINDTQNYLSDNPLTNRKYLFIGYISNIINICVRKGIDYNELFRIGSMYIQIVDKCNFEEEIFDTYKKAIYEITTYINNTHNTTTYSNVIIKSLNYIYANLNINISVEDISKHINLSPSYFSALFKKEIGMPVAKYILHKRIDVAKNMLKDSNYSCSEICNCLAFCSQSHFISSFKSIVGITPKKYRIQYFKQSWL